MPASTSLRRAPVQRRSAERLTRILDACAELLDEGGYDELSTRSVASRADVPIGSVYRFFGNKRAMVAALAERNLERYAERVTRRLDVLPAGDWRAATDVVLDEYLAMKRTAPGFSLVDFGTQIPVGDPEAGPNHRLADLLADLLAPHLGRAADDALRRTFLVAVEAADAVIRLAFRLDPAGDADVIEQTRVLLRGYLAGLLD
ncbi:TetR/AcrR family transcriptional regulator [Streptomyces beihaiensis]|uniref:TetR family transcriptional regulator n=1 Tax=Streptomyces beihaiensis TaxID=2984495 RepID=A0ABT3U1A9_9ACTN|nr:TetR/AcrR family transcriptional regulator [Streptomyces beihaiensis]MCX3063108.1 TetR family transcriptional regulator [Streptomyces beihaiensis]